MKSPNESLDIVLNYFCNATPAKQDKGQIAEALIDKEIEWVDEILAKLIKDGYVISSLHFPSSFKECDYTISFEGRVFNGKKGYVRRARINFIKYIISLFQVWILTIGTGIAGVYAFLEIIKCCKK